MRISEHAAYGGAASAALFPFFGAQSLLFFFASVLIDIDHYIDFLYYGRFKDWSIRRMFRFHGQMAAWRHRPGICALEAFHTAEFLLSLLALALFFRSTELALIFSGMIFHLVLDVIRLSQWGNPFLRAFSFVEYVIRRRRMRKAGDHPERLFRDAYAIVSQTPPQSAPISAPLPKEPVSA